MKKNIISKRELNITKFIISGLIASLLIALSRVLLGDYASFLDSISLSLMTFSALIIICYESLVINKKVPQGPIEKFLNQRQKNIATLFIYFIIACFFIALTAKFLPSLLLLTSVLCTAIVVYGFLNTLYPEVVNTLYTKYTALYNKLYSPHVRQNKYTDITIFIFAYSTLLLCFFHIFFINAVMISSIILVSAMLTNEMLLKNFDISNHLRHCLIWIGILPPAVLIIITLSPSHIWLFVGICLPFIIYDIANNISPIKLKDIINSSAKVIIIYVNEPIMSAKIFHNLFKQGKEKRHPHKDGIANTSSTKYQFRSSQEHP